MTSILLSPVAYRYRAAASAFCTLIEQRGAELPATWLGRVHALLPEVYAAALALPDVEPDATDAHPSRTTCEEWKRLYDDIGSTLGRWNYYWDVFDPYSQSDHEPVCGSLADDLAEIYRDLREGQLAEDEDGRVRPNDVIWCWRFAFVSHWSGHASGAIRALATAVFIHYADQLPESFGPQTSSDPLAS